MKKSNVYTNARTINCTVCGKDLMENPDLSLVNIIQDVQTRKIICVKPCCKGECDKMVSGNVKQGEISGWKDISDFTNPYLYLKHVMAVLNGMYAGEGFENEQAFEDYKKFLIDMYPYITRELSEEEVRAAALDNAMPF